MSLDDGAAVPLSAQGPIAASLRSRVDAVIRQLPADRRGTADVVVGQTGVEVQFAQRLTHAWSVGAWGAYTWSGRREIGAQLRGAW